jgi:hypothetical protein
LLDFIIGIPRKNEGKVAFNYLLCGSVGRRAENRL